MKTVLCLLFVIMFAVSPVLATNGVEVIGVGPISRSMGGVGIAQTKDAVSAMYNNPAALSMLAGPHFDFDGSVLLVKAHTRVNTSGGVASMLPSWSGSSEAQPWAIPAVGFSVPLTERLNVGLAAIGSAGLGVDYRNKDPLAVTTNLGLLQLMNAASYKVTDDFSLGGTLSVNYQSLDMGAGESHAWGVGAQVGGLYQCDPFSFGVTYRMPQLMHHRRISDMQALAGDPRYYSLKLELPQKVGAGIAYTPCESLLLETDVKWIDWSHAKGYKDFDWDSQWVFSAGAEVRPVKKVGLRFGYSYGTGILSDNDNWAPLSPVSVQGKTMPNLQYEYLRVVGFPAVMQHHLCVGMGIDVNENMTLNLGVVHALRGKAEEHSAGGAAVLKTGVSQTFFDFGVSLKF